MATEIRGLHESELEAHSALVHASYYEYVQSGERTFLADPHWWLKGALADPYYEPDQTRVMVIDGQLVASVTNYLRQVYADGRLARVSCIGSVCTHPDFRRRGLVRQVLADCLDWMQREGFHWSFLFGKEEVYGGSGWTILSSWTLTADLHLREGLAAGLSARPLDLEQDLETITRLYDEFNATLTGPIVRSETYWRTRVLRGRFERPGPQYQVLESDGRPIGYYCGGDGSLSDVGWVEQPQAVLAFLLGLWPDKPVSFPMATSELIARLREISTMPGYQPWREHAGGVQLTESYRGLWRYIGDRQGVFPEISDTESLKRFLRDHDYCWWPGDGF